MRTAVEVMAVPSRLRWLLPGHSLLPATGLGIAHDPLQPGPRWPVSWPLMAASVLGSLRSCASATGGAPCPASEGSGSGSGSGARGGGGGGEGKGNSSVHCATGGHTQIVQMGARGSEAPIASGPAGGGHPRDAFERRLSAAAFTTTTTSSSSSNANRTGMGSDVAAELEAQAAEAEDGEAVRGRVERARQALAAARRGPGNTGGDGRRGGFHGREAAAGARVGREAAWRDAEALGSGGGVQSRAPWSVSLGKRRGGGGSGSGSGATAVGAVQQEDSGIGAVGGSFGSLEGAPGGLGAAEQNPQATHTGQGFARDLGWWRAPAATAAATAHGPAPNIDTGVHVGRSTGPSEDEAADRVVSGATGFGDAPETTATAASSSNPPPLPPATPSPSATDRSTPTQAAPSSGHVSATRPDAAVSPDPAAKQHPDTDALLHHFISTLSTLRDAELLLGEWGPAFRSPHAAALLARLPHLGTGAGAGGEGGGGANVGPRVRHLVRLLTHGSLHSVEQVSGPSLARCVAAYAHLSYAPPEAVPQMVSALLSYYAHKLRACSGPDLAELAWGLAVLQSLYGDVHQAVRRPAYTARLMGEGARIVGVVPGGMHAGQAEEVGGMLEGGVAKVQEVQAGPGLAVMEGRTATVDCGEERAVRGTEGVAQEGAEASGLASGRDGGGSEGMGAATGADDGGDGAVVVAAVADSEGSRRRRRRRRRQLEGSSGDSGGGGDGEGRALVAADGETGAVAAGGGQAAKKGRGSGTGAAIWLVPVAMTKISERLALAAGSRADQGGMEGEHLAKVAWAYAKVGVYDARLMDRLAAAALRLLPKLKSTQQTQQQQGAAQSRPEKAPSDGAHAIDDVNDALAVRQLIAAAAATGAAAPLDPVTVTNLAWAYGELRHSHTGLMAGLASVFVPYKSQYDNEMVARLARSYAALGQYDSDMCAALSILACRRLRHLSGSEYAALVGSLAALRHRDGELSGAVGRAVWAKREQLQPAEAVELMWAVAQLGLGSADILLTAGGAGGGGAAGNALAAFAAGGTAAAGRDSQLLRRRARAAASRRTAPVVRLRDTCALALALALRGRCAELGPGLLAQGLWALALLMRVHPPQEGASGAGVRGDREVLVGVLRELCEQLGAQPVCAITQEQLVLVHQGLALAAGLPGWWWEQGEGQGQEGRRKGHTGAEGTRRGAESAASAGMTPAGADAGTGAEAHVLRAPGGAAEGASCGGRDTAGDSGAQGVAAGGAAAAAIGLEGGGQGDATGEAVLARPLGALTHASQPLEHEQGEGKLGEEAQAGEGGMAGPGGASEGEGATRAGGAAEDGEADMGGVRVRQVYDQASGRMLWEVVEDDRDGDGEEGAQGAGLAGLLPAELRAAAEAAARAAAEAEAARRREGAGRVSELWRFEVQLAAEELTGHEPLSLWAAPHTAALADLLLLPPPHVTSGAGGGGGGAGGGRGGGSASPSGALDPTAVLLLGPEAACRNPPYAPLGTTRVRQLLLEDAGLRVVALPRFVWRMAGGAVARGGGGAVGASGGIDGLVGPGPGPGSSDEQLCLLGNVLADAWR